MIVDICLIMSFFVNRILHYSCRVIYFFSADEEKGGIFYGFCFKTVSFKLFYAMQINKYIYNCTFCSIKY